MSVRFALAADATAVATHHPNPEIAALAARIVRAQSSEDLPSFEELAELLVSLAHYLSHALTHRVPLTVPLTSHLSLPLTSAASLEMCDSLTGFHSQGASHCTSYRIHKLPRLLRLLRT